MHPDDVVEAVAECLSGAAAQWFKSVKYRINWLQFQEELLLQFDGVDAKARLKIELFSKVQKADETCANFIRGKQLLATRLNDNTPQEILTAVCRQLMKTDINQCLSYPYPATFLELIRATSAIEVQQAENKKQRKASSSAPKTEEAPRRPPGPPKCWFCPEFHLNKDCPQRQSKTTM